MYKNKITWALKTEPSQEFFFSIFNISIYNRVRPWRFKSFGELVLWSFCLTVCSHQKASSTCIQVQNGMLRKTHRLKPFGAPFVLSVSVFTKIQLVNISFYHKIWHSSSSRHVSSRLITTQHFGRRCLNGDQNRKSRAQGRPRQSSLERAAAAACPPRPWLAPSTDPALTPTC
jgi:hypothetical protein